MVCLNSLLKKTGKLGHFGKSSLVDLTFGVEDDNLTIRDLIPAFPFAQKSLAYMFLEQGSSDLHLITPYEIRVSQSGSLKEEQIPWNWSSILKAAVLYYSQGVAFPFLFVHSRNAIGSS